MIFTKLMMNKKMKIAKKKIAIALIKKLGLSLFWFFMIKGFLTL